MNPFYAAPVGAKIVCPYRSVRTAISIERFAHVGNMVWTLALEAFVESSLRCFGKNFPDSAF